MQNTKDIIERCACDEVMDNISFWEGLLDVIEAIGRMSNKRREKCLFGVVKREMLEGKTWRRQILKICLTDNEKRRRVEKEIRSGRIYNSNTIQK